MVAAVRSPPTPKPTPTTSMPTPWLLRLARAAAAEARRWSLRVPRFVSAPGSAPACVRYARARELLGSRSTPARIRWC